MLDAGGDRWLVYQRPPGSESRTPKVGEAPSESQKNVEKREEGPSRKIGGRRGWDGNHLGGGDSRRTNANQSRAAASPAEQEGNDLKELKNTAGRRRV